MVNKFIDIDLIKSLSHSRGYIRSSSIHFYTLFNKCLGKHSITIGIERWKLQSMLIVRSENQYFVREKRLVIGIDKSQFIRINQGKAVNISLEVELIKHKFKIESHRVMDTTKISIQTKDGYTFEFKRIY